MSAISAKPARSLYLHLPFCSVKCHYCDFVVRVLHAPSQIDRYLTHLALELPVLSALAAPLHTLYLGGGTPSLLQASQIQSLSQLLHQHFDLHSLQEWTLEANPESLEPNLLQHWLQAGVNRVSLGVQSFDPALLASCGRPHHLEDIYRAVKILQASELNYSLDLIYGLPGQSLESWEQSLTAALQLGPDHLSLYALEVHRATHFGHQNLNLPDDERVVAMYQLACEHLAAAGYQHYELANWCLPGRASQHNRVYWQHAPFLAAGVGAHGYIQGRRYAHERSLAAYYQACQSGHWPWQNTPPQSLAAEIEETVFLGLRLLQEGLDLAAFEKRFQRSLLSCYPKVLPRLLSLAYLSLQGQTLRLNPELVSLSNEVFAEFLEPSL